MPNTVVQFAEFELDQHRYQLRRGERVLKLEKIPMELLTFLVESNGRLVTREEIANKIWGKDVFLDTEHGINTAVRKIRQVLGDDPEQPRFVQTVMGKGYRFIAPLAEIHHQQDNGNGNSGNTDSRPVTAESPSESQVTSPDVTLPAQLPVIPAIAGSRRSFISWRTSVLTILAAAVIVLAALVGFNARGWRNRLMARRTAPQIHSLAVLPFDNLSGDPAQEYFADGMTDELITMIVKDSGLPVISRTSVMQFKKPHRPLPDIARDLGVDGVLEGSVERSGNRVRINAQLIYAPTDTHLWAESYDRDLSDLNSLQAELAQTIARQVGVKTFRSAQPEKQINGEAHDAYLLGRYNWFSDHLPESRKYFEKAIELQPDYAAAWSGLADYYIVSSFDSPHPQVLLTQAEDAVLKAIRLDDSLAVAHNTLGALYLFGHWDPVRADQEALRSIQLDPSLAEVHHLRAKILFVLRRPDEALQEQKKATEMDPFSRPWALTAALMRAHKFDAALEEGRVRANAQPRDPDVHYMLSFAYGFKGMDPEVAGEWQKYYELSGDKTSAAAVRRAFRRGGLHGVWLWQLADMKRKAEKNYVSPLDLADVYSQLRLKEEALRYLELAYEGHVPILVMVPCDPSYDFLNSDPRYQALIKKMGLSPQL